VKTVGGSGHPCALAGNALKESGYDFEIKTVSGFRAFKNLPFLGPKDKRDEVIELSGQPLVPILVLDNSEVITGSRKIAEWAKDNPASS